MLLEFATQKRKRKTRNCSKGYPCGNSCINKQRKCKKKFSDQAATYAGWLKKNGGDRARVIRKLEDRLRLQRFESAALFDASGRQLLYKDGAAMEVRFTDAEGAMMKDGVLTHNHPDGWSHPQSNPRSRGNSFSSDDLSLAVKTDLAEIRAVSPGYRHSFVRPTKGWGDPDRIDSIIEEADKTVRQTFQQRIYSARNKFEQDLFLATAEAEHWHEVTKIVADKTGAKYTREEYREQK